MQAPSETLLSIVIPVYYNADSLLDLFDRLKNVEQTLLTQNVHLEIIFIDDGSKDNSFDVLLAIRQQRPQTKLIKLTRNFGEIAASSAGFAQASGHCVVTLAADLQEPPEQIFPMLAEWQNGHKLVFSCRRSREDPWGTKLLAGIYYKLLELLVVKGFPKTGTGMVLMDRSLLPYVRTLGRRVSYALYLFSLGFDTALLSYDRVERKHGKSRWTFKKKFFYFLDTITGFSATPLRLISAIGLIVSFLSMAYGTIQIIHALIGGTQVPGFVTLAVLISFATGIIVTMLSIIGEYLWRIFEIISHHPKSVIEKTYDN
jgi:glycosyltransferase involved in cell wall biosynthesis